MFQKIPNRLQTTCLAIPDLCIKIMAMVPAIAIAAAIFYFSSQPAEQSTVMSDGVTQMLLHLADRLHLLDLPAIDVPAICERLSTPVRKCAHITEYTCFYLSLLFGLHVWKLHNKRASVPKISANKQLHKRLLTQALAITFFYACTDEFHQLFVPGRAGRFSDVLIDCTGAVMIWLVYHLIKHRFANF